MPRESPPPEIVWLDLTVLVAVSVGVILVIGSGSLFKIMQLRSGGETVAAMLGARRLQPNTRDLTERRILNVVEEMALASGIPVPPVYVLDNERGINAFAAGYGIDDAVIGFNRGTIELLNRDELQGVVAHEFSHILNGDMRMSIRLIGVLHGIQLLALIGYILVRASMYSGSGRNNKGGGMVLILLAVALIVVGSIGLFFARMIKASVSRQREYLADASAVQFTRNPEAIAGALKMIGAHSEGSVVETPNAEVASHMYFADMFSSHIFGWLATHPPLLKRIQRIEPPFDGNYKEYLRTRPTGTILGREEEEKKKPPVTRPPFLFGGRMTPGEAASRFPIDPALVIAGVGLPSQDDMDYTHALVENIPGLILEGARDLFTARCLVFAALLDRDQEIARRQLQTIAEREGGPSAEEAQKLLSHLRAMDPEFRLPVFEIVQGTLVGMSWEQFSTFRQTVERLIEADDKTSLFEFFLQHHLLVHLERHFGKKTTQHVRFKSIYVLQEDIMRVLGLLAKAGHEDPQQAEQAFAKAMESLKQPGWGQAGMLHELRLRTKELGASLDRLSAAAPQIKKNILAAAAAAITYDNRVTVEEAELFRAISESLDCPVPPMVARQIKQVQNQPLTTDETQES